jgi:hypothetical protein
MLRVTLPLSFIIREFAFLDCDLLPDLDDPPLEIFAELTCSTILDHPGVTFTRFSGHRIRRLGALPVRE